MSRPTKNKGFDDTPLWSHVEVLPSLTGGGGNRKWRCKYCNKIVTSSYSKVKAHLLKISNQGVQACKAITDEIFREIKKENDDAEHKKRSLSLSAQQKQDYVSLPEGSDLVRPKKRKGLLEMSFNVLEREEADKECAMMFYTGMISFNFARNPHFTKFFQRLANGNLHGYVPPSYKRLRTTLIAQMRAHVDKLLQPIRDSWTKKGASICSDGWQDLQSRPLINIMIASAGGPMFQSTIDASEILSKDVEYLAEVFTKVIEEIGESKVVQVITDNASNYKAAGAIIENKFPSIFWTPCVVHCLNLVLKSICEPSEKATHYSECQWISQLVRQVNEINNFIKNHGLATTIFERYADMKLLNIAETRFGSKTVMATRLQRLKEALEKTMMDPDWKKFKVNGRTPVELKAREVKDLLVSDTWWDQVDYLLKFTLPMMNFLRAADMDSSMLHLVYDLWDSMIEEVKKIIFEHEGVDLISGQSSFFDAIHSVIESRWNKSNMPLHCLGHSLVPKYYTEEWLQGGKKTFKELLQMKMKRSQQTETSVYKDFSQT